MLLTKIDVAERQLVESIWLFFENRDPVSVHTLASAALQVLTDVSKAKGLFTVTRNEAIFKPGKFKEWLKTVKAFENFSKHADNDPDGQIELRTETTRLTQFEAVWLHQQLKGKFRWETIVYLVWAGAKYPDIIGTSLESLCAGISNIPHAQPENLAFYLQLLKAETLLGADKFQSIKTALRSSVSF